jgi:Nitrate/nitrite transporter
MKHRGLMFAIMYICAVFCSISQLKIVPILGLIGESLAIDLGQIGWLMSVFTIAGIILAIPAGGLVGKFGPKKVFLAVMIITVLGNIVGVFGLDNYTVLLSSRILEGCGFAMASVAGIVLINMWFPDKNTGLFVGIFVTFAAVASVVALNLALPMVTSFGMASVWWITALGTAIFTVLFWMFVKEASPQETPQGAEGVPAPSMTKPSIKRVLTSGPVLCICLAQLTIGFFLYFYMNNYPQVFGAVYNLDAQTANFYGSLNGLWGIPGCVFGGFLLDKLGKKGAPKLDLVCFAVMFVAAWITTGLNENLYILHTILTAVFPGLVLTAGNFLVPQIIRQPQDIGYGIGTLGLFYNIGIFVGNPIILSAVQATNDWAMASMILSAVSAFGFVMILIYMAISRKDNPATAASDGSVTESVAN